MTYCCSSFVTVWQLPLLCCGRFCDRRVFAHSVATPNKRKRTSALCVCVCARARARVCELFKNKLEVVARGVGTVQAVI
jgi:hypothetical protein